MNMEDKDLNGREELDELSAGEALSAAEPGKFDKLINDGEKKYKLSVTICL